jgi:hypothetical protein
MAAVLVSIGCSVAFGLAPLAFTVERYPGDHRCSALYEPCEAPRDSADHTNVSLPHTAARSLKSSCGLVDGDFGLQAPRRRRIQRIE